MTDGPSTGFERAMETLEGRCISCGFLAKHSDPGKGLTTYFEVEASERAAGEVFAHAPEAFGGPAVTAPICFRSAFPLAQEKIEERKSPDVKTDQEAAQRVFLKDRRCAQWFQYTPGLSPQQHLGGLAAQEQEQRQYKFQESMEQQRREWERQLEDERRGWERQLEDERRDWERKLEGERRRFDLILAGVVALFAVAEVTATVVGIFFIRRLDADQPQPGRRDLCRRRVGDVRSRRVHAHDLRSVLALHTMALRGLERRRSGTVVSGHGRDRGVRWWYGCCFWSPD